MVKFLPNVIFFFGCIRPTWASLRSCPRHFWYQKWRTVLTTRHYKNGKLTPRGWFNWGLQFNASSPCGSKPLLRQSCRCFFVFFLDGPSIIEGQKASQLWPSYEDQWTWQLKVTPNATSQFMWPFLRFFCFLLCVPLFPAIFPSIFTTCCPPKSPVLRLLIELTSFVCRFQCLP